MLYCIIDLNCIGIHNTPMWTSYLSFFIHHLDKTTNLKKKKLDQNNL